MSEAWLPLSVDDTARLHDRLQLAVLSVLPHERTAAAELAETRYRFAEKIADAFVQANVRAEARLGTPLSELSGRPGHEGYERFKAIAKSWGHE